MAKTAKLLILVEVASNRSQCCDLLRYIATTELNNDEYMVIYTAIIDKMRTF